MFMIAYQQELFIIPIYEQNPSEKTMHSHAVVIHIQYIDSDIIMQLYNETKLTQFEIRA